MIGLSFVNAQGCATLERQFPERNLIYLISLSDKNEAEVLAFVEKNEQKPE